MRNTFLLLPFVLLSCSTGPEQANSLAPAAFEARLHEPGIQLIDVRTPGEYAEGHLAGATDLDWKGGQLKAAADNLDRTKPVLVYCASGRRSAAAREFLSAQGFTDVVDLQGGINAWDVAGKPIEH